MATEVDEPITIAAHDPVWSDWFLEESAALRRYVPRLIEIEHFGSTALSGLIAKPIVDILLGVRRLPPSQEQSRALERLRYEDLGEAGVPGRHYFRKRGARSFNAAIVVFGGSLWADNLLLRDFLRAHPSEQAAYQDAKRRAIREGRTTLIGYSEAKAAFMTALLERARRWKL